MSGGQVVQVIGAVVDVEFAGEQAPAVYDALDVDGGLKLEFSSNWATVWCAPSPWAPRRG